MVAGIGPFLVIDRAAEEEAITRGEGVPGSFTAVTERCSKRGLSCYAVGTFRSVDGASVDDVHPVDSFPVNTGETVPGQMLELVPYTRVYPLGWSRHDFAWAWIVLVPAGGLVLAGFGALKISGRDPWRPSSWRLVGKPKRGR